ncbi:PDDEXK nuclease domain-containing protein [Leptolyngbya sp. NIES-2104]|uniref:PDDEXK nuclease domain-containing protein n=1 Tax=Leptolyngbya sp. NIES-2104 TaxID=1552121 RepID=UPI0006ECA907|nr:PDDEXK nuclease domain-containing protein [Leptolyngbya sp. NIES-2104]GAP99879.1 putative cytoplasmic protein [Leptolyngbya sp. NIES-2104]
MSSITPSSDPAYQDFLREIKAQVVQSRISAARSINRSLIGLYWALGKLMVDRQEALGWGNAIVERLSADLKTEFPEMTGFSPRNLWDIKRFYETYADAPEFLRQLVAEIPWSHNILIMQKVKGEVARRYYLEATARLGWTRNVLLNQIKAGAYEVSLQDKSHNFSTTLPQHFAEQAEEMLKSQYSLEFLEVTQPMYERALERGLVTRLKDFLVELGYGFCFVGSRYRLTLGENEYFLDLLFYHRFLKCLVAIELKTGRFRPEYAGKMDFYLEVLNDRERAPDDNPSIGIILCAERDRLEVEFSLKSKANPIGVATYQLYPEVPEEYRGLLPTDDDWQRLLDSALSEGEENE